jgi:putative ABC transport system permease protein
VRSRRWELALLKTLGFTRRQLARTVAWHATVVAVIGVGVGTPLGIVAGRWLWILFADRIHAVARPVVPFSVAAVALGLVVLSNAIAALPSRVARRTPAAAVLRTE